MSLLNIYSLIQDSISVSICTIQAYHKRSDRISRHSGLVFVNNVRRNNFTCRPTMQYVLFSTTISIFNCDKLRADMRLLRTPQTSVSESRIPLRNLSRLVYNKLRGRKHEEETGGTLERDCRQPCVIMRLISFQKVGIDAARVKGMTAR